MMPLPYQSLYAVPPVHVCGAPFENDGKGAYGVRSVGQAVGTAVCSISDSTAPERIFPYRLITSAARPVTCGDAIDVPCR
jgi:hypothetical protein